MAQTQNFRDTVRFAGAVAACGGVVPDKLRHLLSAHALLSRSGITEAPETAILTAALDGTLDEKTLSELLPIAAAKAQQRVYRAELGRESEHHLLQAWHIEMKTAADQILDSLRPNFELHAKAIEAAKEAGINSESDLEHIVATGTPELVEAWRGLDAHITVVARIGMVARHFGCRPTANFPQIVEYHLAESNANIADEALMCTVGGLLTDSSLFRQPDRGHRTSPWFKCGLKLHTISEARARYAELAAEEFDRIHAPRKGSGRLINGQVVPDPIPPNPWRKSA